MTSWRKMQELTQSRDWATEFSTLSFSCNLHLCIECQSTTLTSVTEVNFLYLYFFGDQLGRPMRHNVKMWPRKCKVNGINLQTRTNPYSWPYPTYEAGFAPDLNQCTHEALAHTPDHIRPIRWVLALTDQRGRKFLVNGH